MPEREPPAWIWLKERLSRLRQPSATVPVVDGLRADPLSAVVTTAVVTDSAAALPADWVSAFSSDGRLTVVPMPVMVGEEIYGEGEDDITETLSVALAAGASIKTSRPSPGQFEQAYLAAQRRGFKAVVSIHLSSELSGTVDAARLAAARVQIPVEVVDSRTVGMAQGMGVQSAVVAAADGQGMAEVRGFAERRMERTKVYFYVPSLEQLRRGGRIGAAASWLGPFWPSNPSSRSTAARSCRSKRCVPRRGPLPGLRKSWLQDVYFPACRGNHGWPCITLETLRSAERLAARLAEAVRNARLPQISALPAVLAAHAGLGVLAVIVGESSTPTS